eukprot:gene31464-53776_t
MAVRLPGAHSPEEYWHNLRNGVESVRFYTDDELLAAGVKRDALLRPNYVKAGAPPEILYVAHPHIGTFKLVKVVENIREQIVALG